MSSFISWLGNEFQGSICFFLLKDEITILVYHVKVVFCSSSSPHHKQNHYWTLITMACCKYSVYPNGAIKTFYLKHNLHFRFFDRRILPEYLYKLPSMPGLTSLNKSISHPNLVIHEYQDITNSSDICVCICVVFFLKNVLLASTHQVPFLHLLEQFL